MLFTVAAICLAATLLIRFFSGCKSPHIDFFIFGALFYFLTPGMVYENRLLTLSPGIIEWREAADPFFKGQLQYFFLLFVLGWLISYLAGIMFYRALRFKSPDAEREHIWTNTPPNILGMVALLFVAVIVVFYIDMGRGVLMAGYGSEYNSLVLGGLGSCMVLLMFLYFVNIKRAWTLRVSVIVCLSVVGIVLLLSGSRMYVVTPLMGFVALGLISHTELTKRGKILIIGLLLAVGFSAAGVLRIPGLEASDVFYIFLAEPVFTSYSLVSFWSLNDLPLISMPLPFISDFINVIPSMLFPNKAEYIRSVESMGYTAIAPLGAASIAFTAVGNFGVAGALVFVFVLGFFLEWLYSRLLRSAYYFSIYICLVGLLPFIFYRDPLSVTVKISVMVAILLPAIMILLTAAYRYIGACSVAERCK